MSYMNGLTTSLHSSSILRLLDPVGVEIPLTDSISCADAARVIPRVIVPRIARPHPPPVLPPYYHTTNHVSIGALFCGACTMLRQRSKWGEFHANSDCTLPIHGLVDGQERVVTTKSLSDCALVDCHGTYFETIVMCGVDCYFLQLRSTKYLLSVCRTDLSYMWSSLLSSLYTWHVF
jgi:hypothetical protein